ncbi:uncharacterized protein K452DRAFT_29432 [Aplosporella prunicola CBS 121167]|uniref:Uncharacterized protein n=1 Tax=Aplosporella prunicola CBS 121167 TaxID=1176127 RepID=A0A6A6ATQ3_9PEZI|nr:uncharacterized protein K452DRAFT_29432 [Aplosporella prunicola CBS 121167]KAF2135349.1 hypothetical protein K452DRAFT_29432 [Aplosporella prunicola CBS 121167]
MAGAPKHEYSTLEVSAQQPSDLPEVVSHDLPEAISTDLPEAVPQTSASSAPEPIFASYHDKQLDADVAPAPEKRSSICGLRKRTFWIALVVALLVIIGVAVGAGVGATRNKDSDDSSSSSGASSSNSSTRGIISTSRLAAANYTDAAGVEHSQLYYQDVSLDIWMADWSEKNNNWTLGKLQPNDNTSDITPRNGTPIAAYNFWYSEEVRPFLQSTLLSDILC